MKLNKSKYLSILYKASIWFVGLLIPTLLGFYLYVYHENTNLIKEGKINIDKARNAWAQGNYIQARELLSDALLNAKKSNDDELKAIYFYIDGLLDSHTASNKDSLVEIRHLLNGALSKYDKSWSYYKYQQASKDKAWLVNNYGRALIWLAKLDKDVDKASKSLSKFRQAIYIANELQERKLIVHFKTNLIYAKLRYNNLKYQHSLLDKLEKESLELLSYAKSHLDEKDSFTVDIYLLLKNIMLSKYSNHRNLSHLKKALEYIKEASLFTSDYPPKARAYVYNVLGVTYFDLAKNNINVKENLLQALTAFEIAILNYVDSKNIDRSANYRINMMLTAIQLYCYEGLTRQNALKTIEKYKANLFEYLSQPINIKLKAKIYSSLARCETLKPLDKMDANHINRNSEWWRYFIGLATSSEDRIRGYIERSRCNQLLGFINKSKETSVEYFLEARKDLEKALEEAKSGSLYSKIYQIGYIYQYLGKCEINIQALTKEKPDYKKAIKYLVESFNHFSQLGDLRQKQESGGILFSLRPGKTIVHVENPSPCLDSIDYMGFMELHGDKFKPIEKYTP